MTAFHGESAIKEKYLTRVRLHREADELIRGTGWENGRGCAIGCTLNKYDHAAYETELGIPRSIARLEDGIFEALPVDLAMLWPERFLAAIRPGADLSLVMARWFVWLLVDPADGVLRFARTERSREAIQRVADLYARKIEGQYVEHKEWQTAYDAAAYAADAANAAARSQARVRQADKLIELLEAA